MSALCFIFFLISFGGIQVFAKAISCPKCTPLGCHGSIHCDVHGYSCMINQHGNTTETRCAPDNECHTHNHSKCCKTEECIQRILLHYVQSYPRLRCPACTEHRCNPNTMCINEFPYCVFSNEGHYVESWCDRFHECNRHDYTCCLDQQCVDRYVKNHPYRLIPCPVCNDAPHECDSHFRFCHGHDACIMSNSSGRIRTHCGNRDECSGPNTLQCCKDPLCILNSIYPTIFPNFGYTAAPSKATTTSVPTKHPMTTTPIHKTTTKIPTTTAAVITATTTVAPSLTVPSTAKCYQCGDLQSNTPCDLEHVYLGNVTDCQDDKSYCQTDIHFDTTGSSQVYKRCVNIDTCRQDWLLSTANVQICMKINSMSVTQERKCHFCCTGDGCNSNVIPDNSTLYRE